ncbi:hypothetical protein V1525DRAFT_395859 [Lipomyces kononenkoae]|uniref:Uncharacterized protein n=1 Tax=Lipomyces kononenkoae TaxID=34357 RepID=A0ACC3T904_LIPKO
MQHRSITCIIERECYRAPRNRISLTKRQLNDQVVQMRRRWLSPSSSQLGGLEFGEHIWLNVFLRRSLRLSRRTQTLMPEMLRRE